MRAFLAALAAVAVEAGKYENLSTKAPNATGQAITVTIDGTPTTKYIASDGCSASGSSFNCPENNRGYILNTPNWDSGNPDFWTPNLLGGSVEWDMDVSSFECGCFWTFYTVSMPGRKSDGSLDPASDRCGDRRRKLVLQQEHVLDFAVVAFRPGLGFGRRVDQAHVQPDAIAAALHAAVDDIGDAEIPCYL